MTAHGGFNLVGLADVGGFERNVYRRETAK